MVVCSEEKAKEISISKEQIELINQQLLRNIVKVRNQKGWTRAELSRNCGISESALSRIEHGKNNISIRSLIRIAIGMSTPLSVFLPLERKNAKPEKTFSEKLEEITQECTSQERKYIYEIVTNYLKFRKERESNARNEMERHHRNDETNVS